MAKRVGIPRPPQAAQGLRHLGQARHRVAGAEQRQFDDRGMAAGRLRGFAKAAKIVAQQGGERCRREARKHGIKQQRDQGRTARTDQRLAA